MNKSVQKGKILCILRYLQKKTDRQYAVTINDIIAELAENNIKAERKSVYSDLALLREYGYNIVMFKSHEVRYYMEPAPFDRNDLLLLSDAVQASAFISNRRANELVRKLGTFLSENDRKMLDRPVYIPERRRDYSEQLYRKIDLLQKAIRENKQITFSYGPAISDPVLYEKISPFLLIFSSGKFFLIAGDHQSENGLTYFELDGITNLMILPNGRDDIVTYTGDIDFSLQRYAEGLFAKERATVPIIACINRELLKEFTEKYKDLHVHKKDGEFLTVEFSERLSADFILFVLRAGENIRILSPEAAAEAIENIVNR